MLKFEVFLLLPIAENKNGYEKYKNKRWKCNLKAIVSKNVEIYKFFSSHLVNVSQVKQNIEFLRLTSLVE